MEATEGTDRKAGGWRVCMRNSKLGVGETLEPDPGKPAAMVDIRSLGSREPWSDFVMDP